MDGEGRVGAEFERALQDMNVVAHTVDRDGRFVWQNRASRELFGDARGSAFIDFVAPEDRRRAMEAFVSKVVGSTPSTEYAIDVELPAGRVQLEINSVPLVSEDEVHGVLAIVAKPLPRDGSRPVRLTPRQSDVLLLLAQGATTDQIATELHIARETVRNHVRAVLAALGAHSRVEAIAAARAAGLLAD